MGSDIYFMIENGRLIRYVENDGWTFMRRGAERSFEEVDYELYKNDVRVKRLVEEYEKKTGKRWGGE